MDDNQKLPENRALSFKKLFYNNRPNSSFFMFADFLLEKKKQVRYTQIGYLSKYTFFHLVTFCG
jgi:hypothetical protein